MFHLDPAGERRCQHRDDGIARARHVEHLAGLGGGVMPAAVSARQQHAARAQRDKDGIHAVACRKAARRLCDVLESVSRESACLAEFRKVRGEKAGTGIGFEIGLFRVDDHHLAGGARGRSDLGNHVRRHASLGIVGNDHQIRLLQRRAEGVHQLLPDRCGDRICDFFIKPQNLLPVGPEPCLCRGRPVGIDHLMKIDGHIGAEQPGNPVPLGVGAGNRNETHVAAEAGKVGCDIRGAARHLGFARFLQHRYRCFRRDAGYGPVDEPVQHHIADHQH